jgi:hypothetical protein
MIMVVQAPYLQHPYCSRREQRQYKRTSTVVNSDNNNLWVPITDSLGNIIAEIDANGNNLGTITSTLYKSGTIRTTNSGKPYLNRSITITPQNQPVRLSISGFILLPQNLLPWLRLMEVA